MPSEDYEHLLKMTEEIEKVFLPRKKKLSGDYTKQQIIKTKALILLGHAEIEHYFETRTLELLKSSKAKWNKSKRMNWVLHSLILHYEGVKQLHENDQDAVVKKVIKLHRKIVTDNNGIKRKNIYNLLLPVGFYCTFFDEAFMTSLEDFGFMRGLLAHKSNSMTVKKATDPFDEAGSIKAIIKQMLVVDKEFDRIKRKRV